MYIPEKLKVKTDTHRIINNVPIAFITYKDEHGKVRSETSWKKWGKIELPDIDNAPLSGYKIFDDVTRRSSYFGSGRTMFNVCHPNGFFFEISSDNLTELVCNCEIKKGVIQGDCVLAWDKTTLAILPTSSNEYQENVKHTQMINDGTVKLSDLKIGTAYCDRNKNNFGYYCGTAKVIKFDINENRIGRGWRDNQYFEFEATALCRILHIFKRTERWPLTTGIANPKVFVNTNVAPDVSKAVYNIEDVLNSHMISFPSELKTEDEVKEFIMNHPKLKNKLEDPRCVDGFVKYGFGSIKKMLK